MTVVKHPVHGNRNVADSEVPALVEQGWVKWPRTEQEKALGDGSAAGYWRAKFEAEAAKKTVEVVEVETDINPENPDAEPEEAPKRRGRPPRA